MRGPLPRPLAMPTGAALREPFMLELRLSKEHSAKLPVSILYLLQEGPSGRVFSWQNGVHEARFDWHCSTRIRV